MRGEYDLDLAHGKFSDLMAAFLYERVMLQDGDFGDDEYSDGDGFWGSRYGRHILEGDDRGFVYHTKFPSVDQAAAEFREAARKYEEGDNDAAGG